MYKTLLISLTALSLASCGGGGVPVDAKRIEGLDADRYLGTWYEIARIDNRFERGMDSVTATYTMREDGGIRVANRGCKYEKGKWSDAIGRAYFKDGNDKGLLKVSFFGPFFGDYIIFDLNKTDYSHAYISGGSTDYLWLLSRTPQITEARKADFISKTKAMGYDTDALVWVTQNGKCIKREANE